MTAADKEMIHTDGEKKNENKFSRQTEGKRKWTFWHATVVIYITIIIKRYNYNILVVGPVREKKKTKKK